MGPGVLPHGEPTKSLTQRPQAAGPRQEGPECIAQKEAQAQALPSRWACQLQEDTRGSQTFTAPQGPPAPPACGQSPSVSAQTEPGAGARVLAVGPVSQEEPARVRAGAAFLHVWRQPPSGPTGQRQQCTAAVIVPGGQAQCGCTFWWSLGGKAARSGGPAQARQPGQPWSAQPHPGLASPAGSRFGGMDRGSQPCSLPEHHPTPRLFSPGGDGRQGRSDHEGHQRSQEKRACVWPERVPHLPVAAPRGRLWSTNSPPRTAHRYTAVSVGTREVLRDTSRVNGRSPQVATLRQTQ